MRSQDSDGLQSWFMMMTKMLTSGKINDLCTRFMRLIIVSTGPDTEMALLTVCNDSKGFAHSQDDDKGFARGP